MNRTEQTYIYDKPFQLETGTSINGLNLHYVTYGTMNQEQSNVIWVCHALTANADVHEWWDGLVEKNMLFDPDKYFVICVNMIGSCYGSTNPLSNNPDTEKPYYSTFPLITNRDIANAFELIREHLNINKIHLIIGASMGGFHIIEWLCLLVEKYKEKHVEIVNKAVLLGTSAKQSPWAAAFNATQKEAIRLDKTWNDDSPKAGMKGIEVARMIALISYRTYDCYNETQREDNDEVYKDLKVESYQKYQGYKLAKRFDAYSYYSILNTMDTHNIGRGRESIEKVLSGIKTPCLVVGIENDLLFPSHEQQFMAEHLKNGAFILMKTMYGHDGFLIETKKINEIVKNYF